MTSRSEKTLRQIRQILQTSDDYERNERNLSQNSPFSCYLTPRANLYNQYPYRIPLSRNSPKRSTKKRKTRKNIEDLVDSPFLFNNSNIMYRQLSNSAKKAFLPYSNSRLNSSSNLYSTSNLNSKLQSQSVQTSLALILDQSDSPDDPITAKQNEILYFMSIAENLILKRFFNRWRQRWFYQTAYNAQKLMQTTGITSMSRHSKRNLTHDTQSRSRQDKIDYENKADNQNIRDNRKNGGHHHHSISAGNKGQISAEINKRLAQTDLVNKNGFYDQKGHNFIDDFPDDYEYTEYDDNDQNPLNNRQIHKHRHSRRNKTRDSSVNSLSNKQDEYNEREYDYEYFDDDENGVDVFSSISENNGRKRRRRYRTVTQNQAQKKMSKTAPFQRERIDNEQSNKKHQNSKNNKSNLVDQFEEDADFSDYSNLLNQPKLIKTPLNEKRSPSRKNSPTRSKTNNSTKIDMNFFDSSSPSLIDPRINSKNNTQSRLQKSKNSSPTLTKSGQKDDRHLHNSPISSPLNSPLNSPSKRSRTNDRQKISQDFFDDSENSLLDDKILFKQKKTQTSSRSQINESTNNSRRNSPSKGQLKEPQNRFSEYSNNSEFENQKSKKSTKKDGSILNDQNQIQNQKYNHNHYKSNNQSSSRQNSPNKSKLNENTKNDSDYSLIIDSRNQNSQQKTKKSSHVDSVLENSHRSSRTSSPMKTKSSFNEKVNQNESDYSIESFFENKTQSKFTNTLNKSTQKNLSSEVETDQNQSRIKKQNQNYDDYSNEDLKNQTKHQRRKNSTQKNSLTIETKEINQRRIHNNNSQNNNNSVDYTNYSDYSNYANSEQEQNQKFRTKNQRNKEFTFGDSKTFSPIKSPKNFDDIVSQIIPDLDDFIEKYSTKNQNLSIDDESDGEFKSLIEKTKFYESKYSHITLNDLDDENFSNRRLSAFNNLIPVNTSLSASQNDPNNNNNNNNKIDSTMPELHEFDHELEDENKSPPLYFNK